MYTTSASSKLLLLSANAVAALGGFIWGAMGGPKTQTGGANCQCQALPKLRVISILISFAPSGIDHIHVLAVELHELFTSTTSSYSTFGNSIILFTEKLYKQWSYKNYSHQTADPEFS